MSKEYFINIYKPTVTYFDSREILYQKTSEFLEKRILEIQENLGTARFLLAGGSTPLPVYKNLAKSVLIDWLKLEIYQTDERYIDSKSDLSNQKNILESFGDRSKDIYFNFFNTNLLIQKTVEDYQEILDQLDDVWFDQAVLGIGEDGHFASLFPGGDYLKHQEKNVIQTLASEGYEVAKRVSLTLETILNSQEILVLLVGKNKQAVLTEMLEGERRAQEFPAKFLLAHPKLKINCAFDN